MCYFNDAEGECWNIRWKHEEVPSPLTGQPTRRTHCFLEKGKSPDLDEVQRRETGVLFSATVTKSVKDKHDKELARKISLKRILDRRFPGNENKRVRQVAWQSYFARNEEKVRPMLAV